jgi:ribosome biogenesis GTPase
VIQKLRDRYDVLIEDGAIVACIQTGSLRHARAGEPVVGDEVVLETTDEAGPGRIVEIRPRRNRIARRAAGPRPVEQVIASNLDRIVPVFAAAQPKPRWLLLDRYLVEAEAAGITPLVCIAKRDLADDGTALDRDLEPYRSAGYRIVLTSAESGEGMDELRDELTGRVSILVGKSGVGKSTLIQKLLAGREGADVDGPTAASLRTAPISRSTGKGCHTTTDVRMLRLGGGGGIIDTPGMREFSLWDIPGEEIARHFPEIRPFLGMCRFGAGCTHAHEPGCAVKEGVRDGRIDPRRYRSYLRLIGAPDPGEEMYKHSADNERRGLAGEAERAFACAHCGAGIEGNAPGTAHRNHCPACLWSLHVDQRPGDRAAGCGGAMEPIAVSVRPDGEWTLVHRCRECGVIKANRIAGDDNALLLMSVAARPLARPPFPLDRAPAGGPVLSYDVGNGGTG